MAICFCSIILSRERAGHHCVRQFPCKSGIFFPPVCPCWLPLIQKIIYLASVIIQQYLQQLMCSVYTELLQLILITRQILASLHFNENVHREVKKKKNGEVRTRVWWPKFKAGEAVVRDVKVEPTYSKCHVFHKSLFMIINIFHNHTKCIIFSPPPLIHTASPLN